MKINSLIAIFGLSILYSTCAFAAESLLRVACDDEASGAEVSVDGKFKGECPIDFPLTEGTHELKVVKRLDDERYRSFAQTLRIGEGVIKRIDVQLGDVQLTELGKMYEAERQRKAETLRIEQERRETERLAIERERVKKIEEAQRRKLAEQNRLMSTGGYVFKDCAKCPEMVVIPEGNFIMGSTEGSSEQPIHRVNIKTFAIARTELTQDQWAALMGTVTIDRDQKCMMVD